jgi:regulator of sirC expression with transglutaminase-like and TPR domain
MRRASGRSRAERPACGRASFGTVGKAAVIGAVASGLGISSPRAAEPPSLLVEKLKVDQEIDPTKGGREVRLQIERLGSAAAQLVGAKADDLEKLRAVRRVIYESGPWNDYRPFTYDSQDPLGKNIENKLLATYLKTRRGNCVSMPLLFIVIADRLGVNLSLVRAPLHYYVRYERPGGGHVNIEATSGGYPARDAYYVVNLRIPEKAIRLGVYMRPLASAEAFEEVKGTLLEWDVSRGRYDAAIRLASEMYNVDHRNAVALVWRGIAYGKVIERDFVSRYPSPAAMPANKRTRYENLVRRSNADIDAAHALGWLDESESAAGGTGEQARPPDVAGTQLPPPPAARPPAR